MKKNNRKELIVFGVVVLIMIIFIIIHNINSTKPKYDKSKIQLDFGVTESVPTTEVQSSPSSSTEIVTEEASSEKETVVQETEESVSTEQDTESTTPEESTETASELDNSADVGNSDLPDTINSMIDDDFRDFIYQASSHRLDSEILDAYCSEEFKANYEDLSTGAMKMFASSSFPSERTLDKDNHCISVVLDGKTYTIYYELTSDNLLNKVYLQ